MPHDQESSGRTLSGPEPASLPSPATTWQWLSDLTERHGQIAPLSVHDGSAWADVDWDGLLADVRSLASALVDDGIEPGDRVVLMAETSYEWAVADFAVTGVGAVVVPVFASSSRDQAEAILSQIDAALAFTDDEARAEVLTDIDPDLDVRSLSELPAPTDLDLSALEERTAALDEGDVATIVFTSGTTGEPKGVPLTHRHLIWTARQTASHLGEALGPGESTLLFLPLGHIFARIVVFAAMESGVQLAFGRSTDQAAEDLRSYRPTFLLVVPRILDRVLSAGRDRATGWKAPIFEWALGAARRWSESDRPGLLLRTSHALADRLVLSDLRAAMGGQVEYVVSGGARLEPRLAHTIRGAGLTVLEGYGLTETTGPSCANTPTSNRIGTVGPPLPGVEIRLSDEGEVQVRGPNVTDGYLNRESPLLEGGWFPTGDGGSIDAEGHLVIEERLKEIIVTDTGENIAPTPLEDLLVEDPAISQAMVIGNDRPFVAALIVPDADRAPSDPQECLDRVQRAVDRANETKSDSESIREFRLVDREFSEARDELTPTLKLKRDQILEHFADAVESIYGDRA